RRRSRQAREPPPVRLRLSLRLRHADRRGGSRVLVSGHAVGLGRTMGGFPILSLVTFLPLVGALLIFVMRADAATVARQSRIIALLASLVTFALSVLLWTNFDRGTAQFQFVEKMSWIPEFGIAYHMGVDGISMLFVLLSTLLTPICVLASWDAIRVRVREYMI